MIKMVYYNPKAVIKKGRKIGPITSTKHLPYFTLNENEILVGIVEDISHVIAPDLTDPNELNLWHNDYSKGKWMNIELYKLKKDEIPNCQDKVRVPINEVKGCFDILRKCSTK